MRTAYNLKTLNTANQLRGRGSSTNMNVLPTNMCADQSRTFKLILPRYKETRWKMFTDKWRDRQTNGWTAKQRHTIICPVYKGLIQKYELYCIN